MPFPFLPLDALPHTQNGTLVPGRDLDAAANDDETLLGRCIVAADHAVELCQRHVRLADCDAGVREPMRVEMLDRARR